MGSSIDEEKNFELPKSHKKRGSEDLVRKTKASMYSSNNAPKLWHYCSREELEKYGLGCIFTEQCFFMRKSRDM